MNKKLTLRLDENSILIAKAFAEKYHSSVSDMVERYFNALPLEMESKPVKLSSIVSELSGIISLPQGFNEKEDYKKSRIEKFE